MLDLRLIRQEPDVVRAGLAVRGAAEQTDRIVDLVVALDEERRTLIAEGDSLKARRNAVSQEVGERKRRGESADEVISEMKTVGDRIRDIDHRLREIEGEIEAFSAAHAQHPPRIGTAGRRGCQRGRSQLG